MLLREDGEYAVINEAGAALWRAISSTESLSELAYVLAQRPNAPDKETCFRVARSFVDQLLEEGFLKDSA